MLYVFSSARKYTGGGAGSPSLGFFKKLGVANEDVIAMMPA